MKYPFEMPDDVFLLERSSRTPYGQHLGVHYFGFSKTTSYMGLAWSDKLLASLSANALHGGVITTLMDEAFGGACIASLGKTSLMATIDLRIDYARPATAGEDLYCIAECYRQTRRISFVRGQVFQSDPDKPIAFGTGTFMVGAYARPPKQTGESGDG
ncbi:MAG: PaaI family thioesterase [Parvibaculales bacterium]